MNQAAIPFAEQTLPTWKRAVLKVGSSLLANEGEGLSPRHALNLAQFVSSSLLAGREVVIVSSGAVAAGRGLLHRKPAAGVAMAERQALAALGQAQLIGLWQRFFERPVAQVLLTHDDLRNRRRYLNARATLQELLALGALPVINENDTVSVDELKLGDNDNLAAVVAALVDADALFIATDIDGFYSANPRTHAEARPILDVEALTPEFFAMAGGAGSGVGTGGMHTKLEAAAKAAAAGIETFLFNGTRAETLSALAAGRLHGTRFPPGPESPRRAQVLAAQRTGGNRRDPGRCRRGGSGARAWRIAVAWRRGWCRGRFPSRRHGRGAPARGWRPLHRARREPVLGHRHPAHRAPALARDRGDTRLQLRRERRAPR